MPKRRTRASQDLTWISLLSAALVAGYLAVSFSIEPAGWARAHLHARFAMALGYGHLCASVWSGRRGSALRPSWRGAASASAWLLGYGLYTHACRSIGALPLALLGVSAWHTFENDRAMRRAGLGGRGALGPVSRSRRESLTDVVKAALASALVFVLPRLAPFFDPADVVVAFTLHHLVAWLIFVVARAAHQRQLGPTLRRLAWLHAPALAVCLVAGQALDLSTYLFWSAAHVAHTAWRRRAATGRGIE